MPNRNRAFNTILSGRPGPVHAEPPMDLQTDAADVVIPPLDLHMARGVAWPDPQAEERAVALLLSAERPVIGAVGGHPLRQRHHGIGGCGDVGRLPVHRRVCIQLSKGRVVPDPAGQADLPGVQAPHAPDLGVALADGLGGSGGDGGETGDARPAGRGHRG